MEIVERSPAFCLSLENTFVNMPLARLDIWPPRAHSIYVRFAHIRYDINPSHLAGYIESKIYRASQKHIEKPGTGFISRSRYGPYASGAFRAASGMAKGATASKSQRVHSPRMRGMSTVISMPSMSVVPMRFCMAAASMPFMASVMSMV